VCFFIDSKLITCLDGNDEKLIEQLAFGGRKKWTKFYSEWANLHFALDVAEESFVRLHAGLSASSVIAGKASGDFLVPDIAIAAREDDQVVVHADEEEHALVRIGMSSDAEEIIVALIFWNFLKDWIASHLISATALDAINVHDLSIVASKIDTTSKHANEEFVAAVLTHMKCKVYILAGGLLSESCRRQVSDEGNCNV